MEYFKVRWARDDFIVGALDLIRDTISKVVFDEDIIKLYRSITVNKVEIVLQSMDISKASDPHGFSGYFYKHYRKIIKSDTMATIQYFFSSGFLHRQWKTTFIILIPKVDNE